MFVKYIRSKKFSDTVALDQIWDCLQILQVWLLYIGFSQFAWGNYGFDILEAIADLCSISENILTDFKNHQVYYIIET